MKDSKGSEPSGRPKEGTTQESAPELWLDAYLATARSAGRAGVAAAERAAAGHRRRRRLRLRYTADGDDVAAWPGSPIPKQTCNLSTYLVQSKGKTVKR